MDDNYEDVTMDQAMGIAIEDPTTEETEILDRIADDIVVITAEVSAYPTGLDIENAGVHIDNTGVGVESTGVGIDNT